MPAAKRPLENTPPPSTADTPACDGGTSLRPAKQCKFHVPIIRAPQFYFARGEMAFRPDRGNYFLADLAIPRPKSGGCDELIWDVVVGKHAGKVYAWLTFSRIVKWDAERELYDLNGHAFEPVRADEFPETCLRGIDAPVVVRFFRECL